MSYFMEADSLTSKVMIYPAVVLLGFAFSSMFVSSLSFATELIGKNTVSQLSSEHFQFQVTNVHCDRDNQTALLYRTVILC